MKIKKILIGILLILITGCNKNVMIEDSKLNYTYNSYHGYYFQFNMIEKINKKEQLEDILKRKNNIPSEKTKIFNKYDDSYFIDKDLIFIYIPYGSGSITSNLSKLEVTDKINVYFEEIIPETGTGDMSGYLYLIEIDKSNKDLEGYIKNKNDIYSIKSSNEFNKTYKVIDIKDSEDECKYVTLSSYSKDDIYTILYCDTYYLDLKKDQNYKFTFTNYGKTNTDDTIKNLFYGNFINTKIEETEEIINEDIIINDLEVYISKSDCIKNDSEQEKFMIGLTLNDGRLMQLSFPVTYKSKNLDLELLYNEMSIDEFFNKLDFMYNFRDGGSKMYKYNKNTKEFGNEDFYVIECNSVDNINNIYVAKNIKTLEDKCSKKIDDLENVSMIIKEGTLTNSGATVIITDNSNRGNVYGEEYKLEKYDGKVWKELVPINELLFNSIGYMVDDGNTLEFKINWNYHYGKIKKGKYRIVKTTSSVGEGVIHYITAEFII